MIGIYIKWAYQPQMSMPLQRLDRPFSDKWPFEETGAYFLVQYFIRPWNTGSFCAKKHFSLNTLFTHLPNIHYLWPSTSCNILIVILENTFDLVREAGEGAEQFVGSLHDKPQPFFWAKSSLVPLLRALWNYLSPICFFFSSSSRSFRKASSVLVVWFLYNKI